MSQIRYVCEAKEKGDQFATIQSPEYEIVGVSPFLIDTIPFLQTSAVVT